jgi:hypothetical protein
MLCASTITPAANQQQGKRFSLLLIIQQSVTDNSMFFLAYYSGLGLFNK